jgi:hypothetical protein
MARQDKLLARFCPHPGSIVRRYQLRDVQAFLIAEGLLEP